MIECGGKKSGWDGDNIFLTLSESFNTGERVKERHLIETKLAADIKVKTTQYICIILSTDRFFSL